MNPLPFHRHRRVRQRQRMNGILAFRRRSIAFCLRSRARRDLAVAGDSLAVDTAVADIIDAQATTTCRSAAVPHPVRQPCAVDAQQPQGRSWPRWLAFPSRLKMKIPRLPLPGVSTKGQRHSGDRLH